MLFISLAAPLAHGAESLATAKGPGADAEILAANVYDHEKYWPNIVALSRGWTPPGAERALSKSTQGVLVRVEREGWVRIDFGRHGKYRVPIEATDLVERANAVRSGRLHKTGPNFLLQIGTRLIDSRAVGARALKSRELAVADRFLVVFADPNAAAFWQITRDLAPLQHEPGLQAIFVPQSVNREDTRSIKDQLRVSGWAMPFSYPRLSANYTRSLLESAPTAPYAILVTPEGRLLFRSGLSEPADLAALRDAIRPGSEAAPEPTIR